MLTFDEAPWVEYWEIDEETGKRVLRDDTPMEIRESYERYCRERDNTSEMRPK